MQMSVELDFLSFLGFAVIFTAVCCSLESMILCLVGVVWFSFMVFAHLGLGYCSAASWALPNAQTRWQVWLWGSWCCGRAGQSEMGAALLTAVLVPAPSVSSTLQGPSVHQAPVDNGEMGTAVEPVAELHHRLFWDPPSSCLFPHPLSFMSCSLTSQKWPQKCF